MGLKIRGPFVTIGRTSSMRCSTALTCSPTSSRRGGASRSKPDHFPVFEFQHPPRHGIAQLDQSLHVGGTGHEGAVRPGNQRVDGVEGPVAGDQPGQRAGEVDTEDAALTNIDDPLDACCWPLQRIFIVICTEPSASRVAFVGSTTAEGGTA